MSEQVYDVDYFIAKFEAIPEEKWISNYFFDEHAGCCAFGHCGVRLDIAYDTLPEALALANLFSSAHLFVTEVNDNGHFRYQQPTPRARILAALHEIKSKTNP